MKKLVSYFGVLGVAILAVGCLDDSITGTRPLTFSLTVENSTAAVGEDVTFRYDATATQIIGVVLSYGDGQIDSLFIGGNVVEAAGPLVHAYDSAGTYNVLGRLESRGGIATDEVTVTIN